MERLLRWLRQRRLKKASDKYNAFWDNVYNEGIRIKDILANIPRSYKPVDEMRNDVILALCSALLWKGDFSAEENLEAIKQVKKHVRVAEAKAEANIGKSIKKVKKKESVLQKIKKKGK